MSELLQQVMVKNAMKALNLTPEKIEAFIAPYAVPVIEHIKAVSENLQRINAKLDALEAKINEIETNQRVLLKDASHDEFLERLQANCMVTQAQPGPADRNDSDNPLHESPIIYNSDRVDNSQLTTEPFYQR